VLPEGSPNNWYQSRRRAGGCAIMLRAVGRPKEVRGAAAVMADLEAARCDVVRAMSAETTETWRRCMAAWRLRRPWRSG
jgi:hypothetical protein